MVSRDTKEEDMCMKIEVTDLGTRMNRDILPTMVYERKAIEEDISLTDRVDVVEIAR